MGRTIISEDGCFEWDEEKNRRNLKKHGFSFDEILEVFDDPALLEGYDRGHSQAEDRYYCIGCLNGIFCVIVFYAQRERTRIISARQADAQEQERYNGYFEKIDTGTYTCDQKPPRYL
ncbi:MAG: BrnT family toxin [Treponema sp.]|nr:BrnT family toxin [Treponema sp.]